MSTGGDDRWKPLESLLGPERCAGFMFMGRLSNGINEYKHGIGRRHLFLDDDGRRMNAFRTAASVVSGRQMRLPEWRSRSGQIGETLKTPYNCEYIRRKDDALRAAGFEVLRVHIGREV